ncbi:hypothetical protein LJC55_00515 [Eubacteriales bacterium OttesenSCG-928-N14]|nr:hypothetical protein [Eubacteriales bacterium OttesenSCG-928-N14]
MQTEAQEKTKEKSKALLAISNQAYLVNIIIDVLTDFLHMFISMYISELLVQTAVFGGALYVAGQLWIVFARMYGKRTINLLPSSIRAKGVIIFVAALALNVLLIVVYPWITTRVSSLILFLAILLLVLREGVTDYLSTHLHEKSSPRSFVLIVVHLLFIVSGMFIFSDAEYTSEYYTVFGCLAMAGLPLLIKQLYVDTRIEPQPEIQQQETTSPDPMMEVSSYRIYNRMVVNLFIAINLSITMYIFYMRYLPYSGFLSSFLGLLIWLGFTIGVSILFVLFLRRRTQWRYDKPTLFIVGALLWIIPTIGIYNGYIAFSGYNVYLLGAIYGIGLACMLSIIVSMGIEMKTVIEIGVGKIDEGAYERNTYVMIQWSLLLSWLLVLAMLTLASFIMDGRIAVLDDIIVIPQVLQLITLLVPMTCVIAALAYCILQPLDRQYAQKLRTYRRQMAKGELNPALEERLKKVLVASYPKRLGIQVLKFLARPFIPMKVLGKENVEKENMPVVFVCNHYEIYGPVAAVVRVPYYFRPWVIHSMIDKQIVEESMRGGVDKVFRILPQFMRNGLRKIAVPLVLWILNSLDPIPVYQGNHRGIVRTMQMTVEALEYDDNILIFPENPSKEEEGIYRTDGISEFFTGFAAIASSYYRKTNKILAFIPIFIDKEKQTLSFGDAVHFDPNNPKQEEKQRIADELYQRMKGLDASEHSDK